MRLSGFHGLERFRVGKIPAVLPDAGPECTESPDVSWPQTSLHGLAGQRWAGGHDPGRPRHPGDEPRAFHGKCELGQVTGPLICKTWGLE